MKKKTKILSAVCVVLLLSCMLLIGRDVQAEEERAQIDGSYLTHDSESIGYDTKITRGQYLLTGYSKCVERGV